MTNIVDLSCRQNLITILFSDAPKLSQRASVCTLIVILLTRTVESCNSAELSWAFFARRSEGWRRRCNMFGTRSKVRITATIFYCCVQSSRELDDRIHHQNYCRHLCGH